MRMGGKRVEVHEIAAKKKKRRLAEEVLKARMDGPVKAFLSLCAMLSFLCNQLREYVEEHIDTFEFAYPNNLRGDDILQAVRFPPSV